jgi:phage shock protein E
MLKKTIIIIGSFIVILFVVYFIAIATTPANLKNDSLVSPQIVKEAIESHKKVIIVDVRTPEEYKAGHLKNSILLTLDTIDTKAAKILPNKNQLLYVYCRTGVRSKQAVSELKKFGYDNAHSMDGGITGWIDEGFTVEK